MLMSATLPPPEHAKARYLVLAQCARIAIEQVLGQRPAILPNVVWTETHLAKIRRSEWEKAVTIEGRVKGISAIEEAIK